MKDYNIHHVPGAHLVSWQREIIARAWNGNLTSRDHLKVSVSALARRLGLPVSTLDRELRRGWLYPPRKSGEGTFYAPYDWRKAQLDADERASGRGRRMKVTNFIAADLAAVMTPDGKVSPETAVHILLGLGKPVPCCLRTIYNHIHAGDLGPVDDGWLPRGPRPGRRHAPVRAARRAPAGWTIDDMAPELLERETPGVWEMDTVVSCRGGKGGLLVLSERRSRFYLVEKICGITRHEVVKALRRMRRRGFLEDVRGVLTDNGCEFGDRSALAAFFKADVYYTHAYAAWEKGSVENANGLVRRWFPKGTDFSKVSRKAVARLEKEINNIYRRTSLKGRTASEAFQAIP